MLPNEILFKDASNKLLDISTFPIARPFITDCLCNLVPKRGLEPPRGFPHYPLKIACLPIPPLRQFLRTLQQLCRSI